MSGRAQTFFRTFFAVLGLAASGLNCAPQIAAQPVSGCKPAIAGHKESRIEYLKELVSSTAPDRVQMRQELGLAKGNPNKVALVTKTATCNAAIAAINSYHQTPGVDRQVWVFALGTGYAVEDPTDHQMGERRGIYIFDLNWNRTGTVYAF